MKKSIALITTALLLTGCAQKDDAPAPNQPKPATSSSKAAPKAGTVGTPVPTKCAGMVDCNATYTITSIDVSDECKLGDNDYGDDYNAKAKNELAPGEHYLQVEAILDVPADAPGFAMLEDLMVTDKDGFTTLATSSARCKNFGQGYELWSSTVSPGEKKRLYEVVKVPAGTASFTEEGTKFDISSVSK